MKHTSTKLLVLVLLLVALLSGYNYFKRPFLARFTALEQTLETMEILPAPDPVAEALATMTVREKLLQMVSLPVTVDDAEASVSAQLAWAEENRPGFITLFGSNLTTEETAEVIGRTRFETGYWPLIAVDHEGGVVQRLSGTGFSRLPTWRQSCQLSTTDSKALFTSSAKELAQVGVQIVFAPVLDVARSGSFLGNRACQSAAEIAVTAEAYITSFAEYGILPVVKHFPGIGSATSDLHFQLDSVTLEAEDTLIFDQILGTFPNLGVMTTHAVVAGRTDGVPCSLSAVCLQQLRSHFPEALLFTDALEMSSAALEEGLAEKKTLSAVAIQALAAGNEVLVFGEKVTTVQIEEVLIALEERYLANENFSRQLETSLTKIMSLKLATTPEGEQL